MSCENCNICNNNNNNIVDFSICSSLLIEISNICQLACSYCYYQEYQEKNEQFVNLNEAEIKTQVEKIHKTFPNVDTFQFWGAETMLPTSLKQLRLYIKYILENYEKEDIKFFISSNFAYQKEYITTIKKFFDDINSEAELKNKKILFFVQASIDFPSYLHNLNRKYKSGKNSYKDCYNFYITFIKEIMKENFTNLRILPCTHGTLNYSQITKNQAYDIPRKILNKYIKDENLYSKFGLNDISYFPNLCQGIQYTKEDGEKFLTYLKSYLNYFSELSEKKIIKYGNFTKYLDAQILSFAKGFLYNNDIGPCGSGTVYAGLDSKNNVYWCHHFFNAPGKERGSYGTLDNINYENRTKIYDEIKKYNNFDMFYEEFYSKIYKNKLNISKEETHLSIAKGLYHILMKYTCFANNVLHHNQLNYIDFESFYNIISPEVVKTMILFCEKYKYVFNHPIVKKDLERC